MNLTDFPQEVVRCRGVTLRKTAEGESHKTRCRVGNPAREIQLMEKRAYAQK